MPPRVSTATMKRIQREIRDLAQEDLGDIRLEPCEQSIFSWTGAIPGPEGSVYEGGVFKVTITLPNDYPFTSPRVTFDTRIYHMNIASNGGICIDILKSAWSPALSLLKVMLSISSLLTDPNPQDPLVPAIAQEYLKQRAQHDRTAREWTALYAKPPPGYFKPKSVPSSSKGKGKASASDSNQDPEIIEVSSDVEVVETPPSAPASAKGRKGTSTSDRITSRTAVATRTSSRRKAAAANMPQPPPSVAGTKRRKPGARDPDAMDVQDEDDDGIQIVENGGSSQGNRPPKRRAVESASTSADVIEID
ncbi:hypothetical protein FRC02_007806 [Tulasnella sp. 418]|nr:hypothetical protein FRC02_007806 [Tulasnella sp. 418]